MGLNIGGNIKSIYFGGNVKEIWQGSNKIFGGVDLSKYLCLSYFDQTEERDGVTYDKPIKGTSTFDISKFSVKKFIQGLFDSKKDVFYAENINLVNGGKAKFMFTNNTSKKICVEFFLANKLDKGARLRDVYNGFYGVELVGGGGVCASIAYYLKQGDTSEYYGKNHPFTNGYDFNHYAIQYDGELGQIKYWINGSTISQWYLKNSDIKKGVSKGFMIWNYASSVHDFKITAFSAYEGFKVDMDSETFPVPTKRYDEE